MCFRKRRKKLFMRSIASLFFKLAGRTVECIQKGGGKKSKERSIKWDYLVIEKKTAVLGTFCLYWLIINMTLGELKVNSPEAVSSRAYT